MKQYYYTDGTQNFGPYSLEQLQQQFRAQGLTAQTYVWAEGFANWQAAGTVPELAGVVGNQPPVVPPQPTATSQKPFANVHILDAPMQPTSAGSFWDYLPLIALVLWLITSATNLIIQITESYSWYEAPLRYLLIIINSSSMVSLLALVVATKKPSIKPFAIVVGVLIFILVLISNFRWLIE